MSLTRSALREKGITEKEILDYIMEEHGNTVEAAKEKAKETAEAAAKVAIDKLQAKVDSLPEPDGEDWKKKYEDEVAARKTAPDDGEDYKAKFEAEVIAHQATKDTHAAKEDAADVDSKVTALLKAAKLNESVIPKALKLYDRTIVEREKDGSVKNADKVVEAFRAEWGDFFGEVKQQGAGVGTPPKGDSNTESGFDFKFTPVRPMPKPADTKG